MKSLIDVFVAIKNIKKINNIEKQPKIKNLKLSFFLLSINCRNMNISNIKFIYDAGVCCDKKDKNIVDGKIAHKIFDLFFDAKQNIKIEIKDNINECW